jgi:hypothetical protein
MVNTQFLVRTFVLVTALCASWSASALATNSEAMAAAQARYRHEMADCDSGQTNQDLATCRLEARNTLADAPHARASESPAQYQQNALQRCNVHIGDDRTDCEARIRDERNVSGSALDGGVLRKSVSVIAQ